MYKCLFSHTTALSLLTKKNSPIQTEVEFSITPSLYENNKKIMSFFSAEGWN